VMRAGIIQQVDTPKVLYEDPINLFVAGFIGSPAMNFIPARLEEGKVRLPFGDVPIPAGVKTDKRDVIAGIRPEHFEDAELVADKPGATFDAPIDIVEAMGSDVYAYFSMKGEVAHSQDLDDLARDTGNDLHSQGVQFTARLDAASEVRRGSTARLWYDTGKMQVFDAHSGQNLLAVVD